MPFDNQHMDKRRQLKIFAQQLSNKAEEIVRNIPIKKAVLLCEGRKTSIDIALYSLVYPEFIIFPVEGCTDVRKLIPFMKKYCKYPTFGIIDRDNHSKKMIRYLAKEESIYCTKLPFIENIICCPEVLKVISQICGKDYNFVIKQVKSSLAEILADKLKLLNPFNVSFPEDEEIQMFTITIVTKNNVVVHKVVDLSNIMYTFRDKVIVVQVAYILGLHSKDAYYNFIKDLLHSDDYGEYLVSIMSKYLPYIKV